MGSLLALVGFVLALWSWPALILKELRDSQLASIGFVWVRSWALFGVLLLILKHLLASFCVIFYMGGGGVFPWKLTTRQGHKSISSLGMWVYGPRSGGRTRVITLEHESRAVTLSHILLTSTPSSMPPANGTVEKTENFTRIYFNPCFQPLTVPNLSVSWLELKQREKTIHFHSEVRSLTRAACRFHGHGGS